MRRLVLFLFLCYVPAYAVQVFRVDPNPVMTTAGNAPFGSNSPLFAVPNATVALCADSACATPATAYTDASGNTACPINAAVTLPGTAFCTSTTGPQGQFGFWVVPGTYYYTVTLPNGTKYGPFPFTSNTAGVTSLNAGTGISLSGSSGSVTATNSLPYITASLYNFAGQAPGGSLSPGSQTVTLNPCPAGVNSSSVNAAYLYISGTGTSEAVPITAYAPGSGQSCQVTVTAANSHPAGWTIQSATAGIQEMIYALGVPGQVVFPAGKFTVHAPIYIPAPSLAAWQAYSFIGGGRLTSTLLIAPDFPLSAQGVFLPQFNAAITFSGPGPIWSDFGVVFPQDYTKPLASMTHWPPLIFANGINMGKVNRLYVSGAWQAFVLQGSVQTIGQWEFSDIDVSGYGPGVFSFDGAADTIKFNRIHLWPFENGNSPVGDTSSMFSPSVVGLKIGQVNSLIVSDSYFITGTALKFSGSGGASAITVTNTGFDAFGIIDMSEASAGIQMSIDNCVFFQDTSAAGFTSPSAMFVYGPSAPNLIVANSTLYRGSTTQPLVSIVGPTGSNPVFGQVSFLNNLIYDSSNSATAAPLFQITNATGGTLRVKISGNQISYENNLTYTNPMLSLTGNGTALTFQGNTNAGYGSGTWLSIANDEQHFISGNVITGPVGAWTVSLPTIKLKGYYQDQAFQYGPPSPVVNLTGPVTTGIYGYNVSYVCDATSGPVQLNLPSAVLAKGQVFELKKVDSSANLVSFVPFNTDKIEGSNTPKSTNTQYATIRVVSDGTSWWVQ